MGTERKKQEESRLYFHGKIFTSDKENLYADAMIVEDGIIRWIGRESQMPEGNCKRYDLEGACVIPGLIDAHIHIESAYVSPEEFSRLFVPRGSTTISTDPHEIVNVAGLIGLK